MPEPPPPALGAPKLTLLPSWRGVAIRLPIYLLSPLLVVYVLQTRLLYHPLAPTQGERRAAAGDGVLPWPTSDVLRAYRVEPATGSATATVLVFHGNAGHALGRSWYARMLGPLGVRVLLAEYPGFGDRTGELSEASLMADAAATIRLAREAFGAPLLVLGESLGAGVAAAAVARQPADVTGLLLVTPWDTLANVAAHHYPWLPVRLLLRDTYDSVANVGKFSGPVSIVIAKQDEVVPAQLGRALAASVRSAIQVAEVQAGHDSWPDALPPDWWPETLRFVGGGR